MSKAFGGARTGATITLLAQNTDRLNSKFQQIGSTAGQFGADWTKTADTTKVQLEKIEGAGLALGTEFGEKLLPYVDDAIHDFQDLVEWFEKGSTAAHGVEIAIGSLAAVAIGSYLTSKLISVIKLLREFGTAVSSPVASLKNLFGMSAPTATTGTAAGAGPSAGLGGAAAYSFMGSRGSEGIGSIANAMVVAVEAGEYAGLGSMGASGTVGTEENVAATESGAASAAAKETGIAPMGVSGGATAAEAEAAPVAEETAGLGIASTLKGLLGPLMGAGMGIMAGGMIQSATGLKGGTAGTLGGGVAGAGIGAALGSVIPGVGTMIGAGVGGALGSSLGPTIASAVSSVLGGEDYGKKIADSLTKGFGGEASTNLKAGVAKALDDAHKIADSVKPISVNLGGATTYTTLTPAQKAKMDADYQTAGTDIAKQLEAGWSQYKFQSEPVMFTQLKAELKDLPPQAQAYAAQSAIAFTGELEKQGKLSAGAAKDMVDQIEAQFPGVPAYLGLTANASVAEWTAKFNFTQSEASLNATLSKMRGDFPQVTAAMDATAGDAQQKADAMGAALMSIVNGPNSTRAMVAAAQTDLSTLRANVASNLGSAAASVQTDAQQMATSLQQGSSQAVSDADANLQTLAQNIQIAMSSGVLSTSKGSSLIGQAVVATLKAFGDTKIPQAVLNATEAANMSIPNPPQLSGGNTPRGAAQGGFIGQPGEKGPDSVPIVVGRGEAILNASQQGVVNQALQAQGIGGLPEVFSHGSTPHYMASGGYAGGGSSFTSRSACSAPPPPPSTWRSSSKPRR